MLTIAVVTATRAEYGILYPLIEKIHRDPDLQLDLLVTGTHLSEKHGYTKCEIEKDGLPIKHCMPILEEGNTAFDVSMTMANAIREFAAYFRDETPDAVVVLGDRTEMLGVCSAAMNAGVPIIHLHGGELTEGAVDDCVRHAITKMSYLHFPAAECYRRRIIQLGESPDRVFNVGALGVENILNAPLLSKKEVGRQVGIPTDRPYAMMTFHPVTLESGSEVTQTAEVIKALEQKNEYFYLISKANADAGGDTVNRLLEEYASKADNVKLVSSLGMIRYLSAVKYAAFVLGNSSSGIIEAPALGVPTVNIGTRQQGRLMADSVITCEPTADAIVAAMCTAETMEHRQTLLYGDGNTSEKMIRIIKDTFGKSVQLKKTFYDKGI